MSSIYDNWERLVEATLKREQLREIALYCESLSSTASDFDFDSFRRDLADAEILSSPCPKPFSLNELKKATNYFATDNLLAEGEFNHVFKGTIMEHTLTAANSGSRLAVAVKIFLGGRALDQEEWLTEVNNPGQLRHPNLVKLLGYCSDDFHRLLVYEFVPKGSLKHHLSPKLKQTLSWETRINVAIGVAKGLSFVHDRDMIHGNVRSSSILLDRDFSAKLSGFKSVEHQKVGNWIKRLGYWSPPHHYSPPPAGGSPPPPPCRTSGYRRNGYLVPDYLLSGKLTAKYDVYSFGVVLIELLSGRCADDPQMFREEQDLVNWAQLYLFSNWHIPQMDTKLQGHYPQKGAYTVANIACQCVNPTPEHRPSMTEVLDALEKLQGSEAGI